MKSILTNKKFKISCLGFALISIITLGFLVPSCSNENDILSTNTVNKKEACIIASKYVELVGNQYVLNLSEEKAISLGISKADYDKMQEDIRGGNALILESQARGDQVVLNDPKNIQVNTSNIRLKDDGEIITQGCSYQVPLPYTNYGCSAWAPAGATQIQISVLGTCSLTTYTGTISCFGQTTYFTVGGASGGSGTFNIAAGNVSVSVKGQTNCSDGARVTFVFITPTKK
jgi:hypothetical protein